MKGDGNPAGVYCEQINKYLVLVRNLSELTKATFLLQSGAIGLAGRHLTLSSVKVLILFNPSLSVIMTGFL